MPGLSRSRNCQTTKSELPGEHAAQRLAREVHAIDASVGSNVGFAFEIIVDILQSAKKISGECVFHAAANGKADIFSAGRRRNSGDGCGCYPLNETEVRNAESAGREKQPMANGVACLSDQVRCPVKFVSVWRGCGGGDDGEFAVTNCIRPTNIAFDSEHQRPRLPVVTGQYTADDTVGWRAGFGEDAVIDDTGFSPEIANVTTDIKSRPIIGRIDCHHWRLRIRPRSHVCSGRSTNAHDRADGSNGQNDQL